MSDAIRKFVDAKLAGKPSGVAMAEALSRDAAEIAADEPNCPEDDEGTAKHCFNGTFCEHDLRAAIATARTLTAEASAEEIAEEIAGLRRRLSRSDARADRLDSIAAGRGVRARAAEAERDALLSMLGRIAAVDGVDFDPRAEECIADGVDALADRVAALESEAAGVASAERERIIASFMKEADGATLGQRFNGGGLDGASIYNVYKHGAAHVMDSPVPTSDAATLAEDEREVKCVDCDGVGCDEFEGDDRCTTCDGTGLMVVEVNSAGEIIHGGIDS